MIRVESLTKRFGHVVAVDDLSFEVSRGEVVGFLGPNGAGKTTTMRILTGFVPATSGKVSVAGYDILDEPLACKRHIGYLPESVPVYPDMDVARYLHFVCDLKAIPRARQTDEVERAMALTDITDRRSRIIGHLSKGLRKRVGIAQALLGDADLLILDEPTEGLDPNQVLSIRELVASLSRERTVILSTHVLTEVEQTCSRVLIIDRGRLIASDSVEHLRADARGDGVGLTLRIAGARSVLDEAVARVPGSTLFECRRDDADDDTVLRARLRVPTAGDAAEVARAVVASGAGLLEMTRERQSLEDVFVRLTSATGGRRPEIAETDPGGEGAAP